MKKGNIIIVTLPPVMERKWQGSTDGSNRRQRQLSALLKHIDVRVAYMILPFAVVFYLLFKRGSATSIYSYLRHRIGLKRVASLLGCYKNHILFGKNLLDRFYIYAGHKDKFKIDKKGQTEFLSYANSSEPLIVLGSHIGNYEISSYVCHGLRRPLKVLAFAGETLQMQKFRSSAMAENKISMIKVQPNLSHIVEICNALEKGEIFSQMADRSLYNRRLCKCNFLGKTAFFPTGVYYIAEKYRAKIIALFVLRGKKTFEYEVVIKPIAISDEIKDKKERIMAYAKEYVSALEEIVKKYPLQWFNFYDFWAE